jgi:hypothetical protein
VSNRTQDLERAVRRLTGPDGAIGFVAALGFADAVRVPVSPAEYGLEAADVVRVSRLARRDGLEVVLLELTVEPAPRLIARLGRRVQASAPLRRHLFVLAGPQYRTVAVASVGLDDELRELVIDRTRPRPSDLEALSEMAAGEDEGGTALALRYGKALDRSRVTTRFFHDVRAQRARTAGAWRGLPARLVVERNQLALLLLCRFMFLYFLQRQGHLAGDPAYLPNLLQRWERSARRSATFYRSTIVPLFFGALNTRPESRGAAARALGALPYLNGGLFECTALERRYPELDLPDAIVRALFEELLERYRFAVRDASDEIVIGAQSPGIDPEMLGRVFESLMSADRRGDTGTFFTPAATVDSLVRDSLTAHLVSRAGLEPALARAVIETRGAAPEGALSARAARALHELRVLDPACGSGAFLLGAVSRVAFVRSWLDGADEPRVRRDFVANCVHGVDVQYDAALLCALRLWLALTLPVEGGTVEPLPNLDRRIRQGDALLDPLDLATPRAGAASIDRAVAADAHVRAAVRALLPATRAYTDAEPTHRAVLQRELAEGETVLARAWIDAIERRLSWQQRTLEAARAERDLFDQPTAESRAVGPALERVVARREEMRRLRAALEDARSLPFFSFNVHFAEPALHGFDLVLSNPPWVRSHRWPQTIGRMVRARYSVCRDPGWRLGAQLAGAPAAATAQIDLAMLFLERALTLLAPSGTLGMLLPAKLMRSLYGGSARCMLLGETRICSIEDHSLDSRSVFRADAFTVAVVATKHALRSDDPGGQAGVGDVRVRVIRRSAAALEFSVPQCDLPLFPGDDRSPWLIAPRAARVAVRCMQEAGPPIGLAGEMRVRRGVFTGANDALLIREVLPRLGGLASVRAEGWFRRGSAPNARAQRSRYEALIEARAMRPVLRGSDVDAWAFTLERWIIWTHDERGLAVTPQPRLAVFLHRQREQLDRRSGVRRDDPPGAVFRVSRATLGHKVVWRDLARTLEAVAVPAKRRNSLGFEAEVVPLNTVYFIATVGRAEALLLSAYLNSLPVRVFARAIAERAKDARFRFFAWTVGAIPLPSGWRSGPCAAALTAIADRAHAARCETPEDRAELDRLVAAAYGLRARDVDALTEFDQWLNG